MLTFAEAQCILNRITYKPNWILCLHKQTPDFWLLWVVFETIDSTDGTLVSLESRSWYIDSTFTEDAVITAAFLAIQQTEEHELREFFRVDGIGIFNPHITVAAHKAAYQATFEQPCLLEDRVV